MTEEKKDPVRQMREENVRWITKFLSKTLRFITGFMSKDGRRPILQTLLIADGKMICSDGYRMTIMDVPDDLKDLEDGHYTLSKVHNGEGYVQFIHLQGHNPKQFDHQLAQKKFEGEKPKATFAINPKFLKEIAANQAPLTPLIINIYEGTGKPIEICGEIKSIKGEPASVDRKFKTLIMPMNIDPHQKSECLEK